MQGLSVALLSQVSANCEVKKKKKKNQQCAVAVNAFVLFLPTRVYVVESCGHSVQTELQSEGTARLQNRTMPVLLFRCCRKHVVSFESCRFDCSTPLVCVFLG